ncbi:hypothetical protein HDV01_002020 [Terramyces sp. JEL0728]|nr:hypothetical protein HDV01_002020 [Terramyces sp. JEL0728]
MLNIEVIDKKCIVAGSDLRIYELSPKPKLVQINTEFPLISCIASQSTLTALGFATGQIKLVKTTDISLVNDLWSKASRNCNVVDWCPGKKNILLSGLDKAKNEFGLLFWDHGSSQGVSSASWLNTTDTVVAGMGKQLLRGYDLRENPDASPIFTITTKAVNGITSDPFYQQRFASYAEDGVIKLWDIRKVGEAILTITSDFRFGIGGIAWSTLRSGVLSGFGKESPIIRLWEMDSMTLDAQSNIIGDELSSDPKSQFDMLSNAHEPKSTVVYRTRSGEFVLIAVKLSDLNINNIAWVAKNSVKAFGYPLLLCSGKEMRLETFQIPPIRFSSWTPNLNISVIENTKIVHYSTKTKELKSRVEDISDIMYSRAIQGYSLKAEQDYATTGLLNMVNSMPESVERVIEMQLGFNMKIYKNRVRDLALYLCGWHYKDPEVDNLKFQEAIRKIEYDGEFEKAAGLTFLYYADLSKTIECLNSSRNERLMLVAAALAGGFGNLSNESNRNIWKSLCKNLSYQLADPYLRALFGIMSSEGNWSLLKNYVSKWTSKVTEQGRIDGLLLTGWTEQCLDLIEKYIDKSGDIQSSVLLLTLKPLETDGRLENWIEIYLQLLDQWELFHIRAEFDIERLQIHNNKLEVPPQIHVKCQFCSQPISPVFRMAKKSNSQSISMPVGALKSKMSHCPSCSKSFPKCSLCLMSVGVPYDTTLDSINPKKINTIDPLSKFDLWFTWCQSCSHGGHSKHIFEWFESNVQCPVANCDCLCNFS